MPCLSEGRKKGGGGGVGVPKPSEEEKQFHTVLYYGKKQLWEKEKEGRRGSFDISNASEGGKGFRPVQRKGKEKEGRPPPKACFP